jgi:hypothetical protein
LIFNKYDIRNVFPQMKTKSNTHFVFSVSHLQKKQK